MSAIPSNYQKEVMERKDRTSLEEPVQYGLDFQQEFISIENTSLKYQALNSNMQRLFCQQRLLFFQWSSMDVRVGL